MMVHHICEKHSKKKSLKMFFRLDQIALKHQLSALCSLRIREAAANATNWVTNKAQL